MSKILATVGGMPITEDDVNEFLMGLGQRGQSYNNPEGRKMVLNQIIGNKLLLLDAKRNLLEAEPEFKAPNGCRLTQSEDGKRLYVHLIEYPYSFLELPGFAGKVDYAQFLHDGSEIIMRDDVTERERIEEIKKRNGIE